MRWFPIVAAAVALLLATPALADVPQPADYVESCDPSYYVKPGLECTSCGAWHGDPEACKGLEAEGWQSQCRSAGASTWNEVWCRRDPAWTGEPAEFGINQDVYAKDSKKQKWKARLSCSQGASGPLGLLSLLTGLTLVGVAARRRS
jgi:hypothetical protein